MSLIINFLFAFLLVGPSLAVSQESSSIQAPSETVKEAYVPVRHGKLFCRTMGKGSPLIIVHGGPGVSHEYLLPFMGELAKTNWVIFYDQRGSGKSQVSPDADSIKLDLFIEDIEAIRKSFGFGKVSVLGHSWGGHLAMLYAIRHPKAIDKLILSNSMGAISSDFSLFMKEWQKRLGSQVEEINQIKQSAAFAAGDTEAFAKFYDIQNRAYCFNPESAGKLHIKQPPNVNVRGFKTCEILKNNYLIHPFDLTSGLEKLKCKTLVIHGDTDPIPVQTAENIHKRISGSRLIVLEKCGHFPYVESPESYFSHINSFLKDEK